MTSSMRQEAGQCPQLVADALAQDHGLYAEAGATLRARRPVFAATVARGSSDHAASYAASLFAMQASLITASLSPSLITRYAARPDLSQALVLAISQSGASPDLIQVMQAAGECGALRIAIINAEGSRLAGGLDYVLPQRAGVEHSVAATKSFVMTMLAIARLTAIWTQDAALTVALAQLPERLAAALACNWSAGIDIMAKAEHGAYVIGRGPGLAVAQEAALKLKETSNLHAEAVSAAEIQHGPRAVADSSFPVLVFGLDDPGGRDSAAVARDLASQDVPILLAAHRNTGNGIHLPLPPPLHKLLDPIVAVLAFYGFAEQVAQRRGLDPDHPRGLKKVTQTV